MVYKLSRLRIYCLFFVLLHDGCTCNKESDTRIELQVARFEQELFSIRAEEIFEKLPGLKEKYHPFFLTTNDEFWRNVLLDSFHNKLYMHVKDSFKDISSEIQAAKKIFEQYKIHYEPTIDRVFMYTYISNLDYNYPVIFKDTLLFLALDLYLGTDFPAYNHLPRYLARERNRIYIPIDIALAISEELTGQRVLKSETLLSYMIREGIKLYTARKLLPKESEYKFFKYTKDQWDFCIKNERNIWMYFIQNKLLYDSSILTIKKFIDPSPFTKMGTDFDKEIPGQIGRWTGYRIVCAFMKNNPDISPKKLTEITDFQSLFSKANYKP